LPEVDRLLGEAHRLAEGLAGAAQDPRTEPSPQRSNGQVHPHGRGAAPESPRRALARQLSELLERIQAMGIVVRDVRTGLIDFPHLREGRIVNLCWRRGEPLQIHWWHEVAAGFGGRQPL